MNERLKKYFEKNNFKNPFINRCIEEYIADHKRCFGKKITEDMMIDRLEQNLKFVKIFDYETSKFDITEKQVAATYECFQNKIICLYVVKDLVNNKEYQGYIKNSLYHCLTHAIYLIKDKNDENVAREMFGTIEQAEVNTDVVTMKDDEFIEAITNMISTTMCGRGNGNYILETEMMNKITELVDVNLIVESSFNMDEAAFKRALLTLDKDNVINLLRKCLRLCRYEKFKNIAAQRFNAIIEGTGIEEMIMEEEPASIDKLIAAYKIDDISYVNNVVEKLDRSEKLFYKIGIKSSDVLNEQEKEILTAAITGEERHI